MEWSFETPKNESNAVKPVCFTPSDVFRLSQLGNSLPWLSGLDPYRDSKITGDDIKRARHDIETALLLHCLEFSTRYALAKGTSLEDLSRSPSMIHGVVGRLQGDSTYRLLHQVISLLEAAEQRNLTVNVYGT